MSALTNFKKVAIAGTVAIVITSTTDAPQLHDEDKASDIEPISTEIVIIENTEPPSLAQDPEQISLSFHFAVGSDELYPGYEQVVEGIADYLIKTGDTFEIIGCSSPDKSEDNAALSWRRMGAVRNAFQETAIPAEQYMDLYALGEECPPLIEGTNDTPEEQRRASLVLNPVYPQPEKSKPSASQEAFKAGLEEFRETMSSLLSPN